MKMKTIAQCLFFLPWLIAGTLFGQENDADSTRARFDEAVQAWEEQARENAYFHLYSDIERIKTQLALSDSDGQKLKIAAKGVVSNRLAVGIEQIHKHYEQQFPQPGNEEQEEEEELGEGDDIDKPAEAEEAQVKTKNWDKLDVDYIRPDSQLEDENEFEIRAEFRHAILFHPRWMPAVEKSLRDPEKLGKYQSHVLKSNRSKINLVVDKRIALLDEVVILSFEQQESLRKQYTEEIYPTIGNKLISMRDARKAFRKKFKGKFAVNDVMKLVLNDAQLQVFEKSNM